MLGENGHGWGERQEGVLGEQREEDDEEDDDEEDEQELPLSGRLSPYRFFLMWNKGKERVTSDKIIRYQPILRENV